MKQVLINIINDSLVGKVFFAQWETTGRSLISPSTLDANTAYIEDESSKERIACFLRNNIDEIKTQFYQNSKEMSFAAFVNFVVYEFGYQLSKSVPHADGGNVTYSLYVK